MINNNNDLQFTSTDYNQKYLKYKKKYIDLKNKTINNQLGGGNEKNIFLFKAEWCGHCKTFLPTWEKLEGEYKNNKKINFVTFDSEKNKVEQIMYNIKGYPSILIQTGNGTKEYQGNRSEESLRDFINTHLN